MMQIFHRGLLALTTDSRLWIVIVLVVIFPLLFVFFYTSEANVAEDNLETVLVSEVSTIQDAIEVAILTGTIDQVSKLITSKQKEIVKLQIVKEVDGLLVVEYDVFGGQVNRTVQTPEPFKSALIKSGTSIVYPYQSADLHLMQVFRSITDLDGTVRYIFTEHNFSSTYKIFYARADRPLIYLALIFIFIIFLTYWLVKQINYQYLYKEKSQTLNERDLFMNSLVHELRAPLTAMRGYASMIEESKVVPPTEIGYAQKIRESTSRLVNLVNDFLEAARIQSGQLPLTWSETDITSLITRTVEASELTANEKGLVLKKVLPKIAITTKTDAKRLEQVITNVLSNAIKYTPSGTITVSLEKSFKDINIIVADTGRGISADDQKKVFSPFVRVGDKSQLESVTGTGLGMWITRQLVQQLGGKIELESIKGVGTHVIVTVPIND